jgi:hypothetical protein
MSNKSCYHAMARAVATIASAFLCMHWMELTNGTSGIGWFIFSLMIIW